MTNIREQRLIRRIENRDKKIAGLKRKVQQLESALAYRTMDLESLSRNIRREVEDALCNVRMVPVRNTLRDTKMIVEINELPRKS
jgi:hypothetical protein